MDDDHNRGGTTPAKKGRQRMLDHGRAADRAILFRPFLGGAGSFSASCGDDDDAEFHSTFLHWSYALHATLNG
jgi:hypothetical protein